MDGDRRSSDCDQMLIEANPADGGTEQDGTSLIHLLLDQPVQFYLDRAISSYFEVNFE